MKVRTTEFLHNNNESLAVWRAPDGTEVNEADLNPEAQANLHYRLYEVAFDIELDTETGKYRILKVRDGSQVLVPAEEG